MADGVATLVRFGHALRAEGVPVGPERIRVYCEAAAALAPTDLYWAGRASLLWRRDQIAPYDELFARFFGPRPPAPGPAQALDEPQSSRARERIRTVEAGEEPAVGAKEGTASRAELLLRKSFAECTEEELLELSELLARLPPVLPRRRTRRYGPGRPGDPHLRRALRRAAASGGEPFELSERRRRQRVRPLLFVLDVSGSMASYSRGLLLFAYAALRISPDVEVYAFGTSLTHLGPTLRVGSFAAALRTTEKLVPDWDGGTRIGEAIASLLDRRSRTADLGRTAAVVCSDGLETGDPAALAEQVGRLSRTVSRIAWLNPLKEDPRYEPLARGMRAALPYVDVFESGHSLAAVTAALSRLDSRRVTSLPVAC